MMSKLGHMSMVEGPNASLIFIAMIFGIQNINGTVGGKVLFENEVPVGT